MNGFIVSKYDVYDRDQTTYKWNIDEVLKKTYKKTGKCLYTIYLLNNFIPFLRHHMLERRI